MGWHICLIDAADSHCFETNDKLSEVSTNHSLSHTKVSDQQKHSPAEKKKMNTVLGCYCLPNGGNHPENGGKGREGRGRLTACTFTPSFLLMAHMMQFPISPSQGHWPLLKITRVNYGLLSSPLFYLTTKDSLQCLAKAPNEHYKSCEPFENWTLPQVGKLVILPPACQIVNWVEEKCSHKKSSREKTQLKNNRVRFWIMMAKKNKCTCE